jgi:protein ImuA
LHALVEAGAGEYFSTGLRVMDGVLPEGGIKRSGVHEILSERENSPGFFFAMMLARGAGSDGGTIVWCDPSRTIFPPALVAAGIHLDRLYLLRPKSEKDLLWSIAESLRCRGVAAVIAAPPRLSDLEARRLQLAAETGGTTGLLLRTTGKKREFPSHYAAVTRWLVRPCPGETTVQRWKIRLIHGHGGDTQKTIVLEHYRETNIVRAAVELADRLPLSKAAGA